MATDDPRRWWRCVGVDHRWWDVYAHTEATAYRYLNENWDRRRIDLMIRRGPLHARTRDH